MQENLLNINQVDLKIPEGNIKKKFINLLNERLEDYSALEYTGRQSKHNAWKSFNAAYGELDNNWIRMYVIDQEVPKILLSLRRPIKSLVNR